MPKTWIIDDDDTYGFICHTLLQRAGIPKGDLYLWPDGQKALKALEFNRQNKAALPDIVLLDLNMPYTDGWQFIERYRALKLPKVVRIFIQSSSVSQSDQTKAKRYAEIEGYIVKPLQVEQAKRLFQPIKNGIAPNKRRS